MMSSYVCMYLSLYFFFHYNCDHSVVSISQPEQLVDYNLSQHERISYQTEDTNGLYLYGIVKQ